VLGLGALIAAGARNLAAALVVTLAIKLVVELAVLGHLKDHSHGELKRSALLLITHLRRPFVVRLALAALGVALVPVAPIAALVALVGGELLERVLYFSAAAAPRMPGRFA
jgi:formate dehydrogenase iron-sulfur subunit